MCILGPLFHLPSAKTCHKGPWTVERGKFCSPGRAQTARKPRATRFPRMRTISIYSHATGIRSGLGLDASFWLSSSPHDPLVLGSITQPRCAPKPAVDLQGPLTMAQSCERASSFEFFVSFVVQSILAAFQFSVSLSSIIWCCPHWVVVLQWFSHGRKVLGDHHRAGLIMFSHAQHACCQPWKSVAAHISCRQRG